MADNKQVQGLKDKIKKLESEKLAKDNEIKSLNEKLKGGNLDTYKVDDSLKPASYCFNDKNILLTPGMIISSEIYNKFNKSFQEKFFIKN